MTCNLVVLISGSGSNLQAFIDSVEERRLPARIAAVICNKPDAYGLERAHRAGIATEVVDHRQYARREDFDVALRERVEHYRPDVVALAGFMRILTSEFVRFYRGRLLNIHPSLLPKYPGLNTHQRAIDAGDRESGATVHFVTEDLDGGPPIIQAKVPILPGDTPERLAKRVLEQEHTIYPLAVRWLAEGRLQLQGNQVKLDEKSLPTTGYLYTPS